MEEEAVIIAVKGSKAKVAIKRKASCRGCRLCQLNPDGMMIAEVENPIGAKIRDKVSVEMPDKDFLKAVFMLYLAPIFGLIIGAFIGYELDSQKTDIPSVLGGLIGFILAFIFIHYYDKRINSKKSFQLRIIKICKSPVNTVND